MTAKLFSDTLLFYFKKKDKLYCLKKSILDPKKTHIRAQNFK